jgi:hypothetical protein
LTVNHLYHPNKKKVPVDKKKVPARHGETRKKYRQTRKKYLPDTANKKEVLPRHG